MAEGKSSGCYAAEQTWQCGLAGTEGPGGDELQRKMTVGSNKSAFGVQCDNNPKIPQSEGRVPSPGFVKQVRFCPGALKKISRV